MGFDEGLETGPNDVAENYSAGDAVEYEYLPIKTGEQGDLVGWVCKPRIPKVRAAVTLVHGLGEHSDRYRELASRLASRGVATLAFDQQGHGNSPGRRGSPRSYDSMLRDIAHAIHTLSQHTGDAPSILFGHSMGGNLAANFTLRWEHNLVGVILSAPMLLPKNPPKRDQIFAAWLTGKLLPFIRIHSPVSPSQLTHDKREIELAENDSRMHSRVSLRLGTQLLAQGRYALDHAREITLPLLVLHGDEDSTTDAAASHAFCIRVGETAQYVNFPEMYHDVLHEIGREKVYETIDQWLGKLLASQAFSNE